MLRRYPSAAAPLLATLLSAQASPLFAQSESPIEFSGHGELQNRLFFQRGDFYLPDQAEQEYSYRSLSISPQWRAELDRNNAFTLRPFARHDLDDSSSTHADLREALWQHLDGVQEWRIGVDEVFWGVVESRHLVDVINQKDYLERIDGDAKLGQPLLNWNWRGRRSSVELFWLPLFREQAFADPGGRFRPPLPVADADYLNGANQHDGSAAIRWQYSGSGTDLALSYFDGIDREPLYIIANDPLRGLYIEPTYQSFAQWGLEAQQANGNWLFKSEAIYRDTDNSLDRNSWAGVAGLEYTFSDMLGGDLGLMFEYLRDSRERQPADTFQDDLFVGLRYNAYSLASTQILAGFYQDRRHSGHIFKLKADTRVAERFKLAAELWFFDDLQQDELASFFHRDDYFEMSLQYFWSR